MHFLRFGRSERWRPLQANYLSDTVGQFAVEQRSGKIGYHKRSNVVRGWFRCLQREEAKGRRLPEMGLPFGEKKQRQSFSLAGRRDRVFEVLALSFALVPSGRWLLWSPRRGCNLDPVVFWPFIQTGRTTHSKAASVYSRRLGRSRKFPCFTHR